jgi:hypothetical protein
MTKARRCRRSRDRAALERLRAHVAEGLEQAERGEFVVQSLESLLAELDAEAEADRGSVPR